MSPGLDVHYRRYFPLIREKCRRMLKDQDEAQDVAQETFIRLWQRGPGFADVNRATAWAYCTSTRLAVDRIRRRAAQVAPSAPGVAPSAEGALAARQEIERLARGVGARELEAAILSRLDGLGQLEIAAVLGVSERTVRRLLERFDAAAAQRESAA